MRSYEMDSFSTRENSFDMYRNRGYYYNAALIFPKLCLLIFCWRDLVVSSGTLLYKKSLRLLIRFKLHLKFSVMSD